LTSVGQIDFYDDRSSSGAPPTRWRSTSAKHCKPATAPTRRLNCRPQRRQ
jgi:hypothetical protein